MEIQSKNSPIDSKNKVLRIDRKKVSVQPDKSNRIQNSESDMLELSTQYQENYHLNNLIRITPDVREVKVEQIRRELNNGTYHVRAEKIAEKIIEDKYY